MDQQRGNLTWLAAPLTFLATGALAQNVFSITEAGWLAEEGRLEALTSEPAFDREELLEAALQSALTPDYVSDERLERDLLVGEFLFKAPILLGGQAAKAGISCQSCHVNGRGNPHFQFPAISGEPGTADTTHNFFSETLGNGVSDPVSIPDLTQPGKVSHDLESRDLEKFIAQIVVEEFGGSQGQAALIDPLTTFVRALQVKGRLSDGSGEKTAYRPRSAQRDWDDVMLMVRTARAIVSDASSEGLSQDDAMVVRLVLSSARNTMSTIHQRLLPDTHEVVRQWLVDQSLALAAMQRALDSNAQAETDWLASALRWDEGLRDQPDFAAFEQASLYNRDVLSR